MRKLEDYRRWQSVYAERAVPLPRASFSSSGMTLRQLALMQVGDGDDWLAIGPIKIFVDGGFTGPAAYTLKPYRDKPEYRAI